MIKKLLFGAVVLGLFALVFSGAQASEANPKVLMKTTLGDITIELFADKAPVTVGNFLSYVDDHFYDNTIFHRVIKGFMIQGGGYTPDIHKKPTKAPITNEAENGLKNLRGTIAMARTMDPHSATSQFFINHVDNASLDYTASNEEGFGYCVFGKVTAGMDVVDAIANVQTMTRHGMRDVPRETVKIISVERIQQ